MAGTYLLVMGGPGSAIVAVGVFGIPWGPMTLFFNAIGFAIAIIVGIYALVHISEGHFNYAITFGLLVSGKMPKRDALSYVIAQFVGALLASLTALLFFGYSVGNVVHFGASYPGPRGPVVAFFAELIMTSFLLWIVQGVVNYAKLGQGFAGITIGFYIMFEVMIIGTVRGGSVNPARSFGPAVISSILFKPAFSQWIYFTATFIGGVLGAITFVWLFRPKTVGLSQIN
jgi:glycerol uptake facilitator-like aquaporin